ncbi:major Facilitator Superfamily protein [Clostridioides difficile DA00203]|nr:major Facilitator Superfamily protein [Clostridioides difficile CD42]EQG80547.1 major Facilitator Superfamily protein [Clostridioides difficile DA00183]EQH11193.1 major Facilitator Superfamily protein [Clostridioides difficile DA00203]EQH60130.1 major Facilitator Superfamily protein [Clostridioides difficile DA00275]EQI84879.1 major Facilitator Superfamily protein [Clostridioides difficile P2]EQJ29059.1 major Facilitator Superfamily protein [Clostridioides difficile P19]
MGYSAFERGIILSSYAITNILFQLLFGVLADKYQTMKKIVLISLSVYGIASVIMFSTESATFIIYLLLVALSGGLLNTCCSLYDTWIIGCGDNINNYLSFIKTFGSIGWAIGSMVASYLILRFSYFGLSVAIGLIVVLLIINILLLPDIEKINKKINVTNKDIIELLKDKKYILLVCILFLLYSMVVANNCTVIDKMIALNATNSQISLKWSLQSLLEIPTYLAGSYLLKKYSSLNLLKLSAIMITVQFLLFALTNDSNIIIILCVFQVFSTPLILITSKRLIFEVSPKKLRSSSQLIALSIFMGGSSLIIPTVAGFLSINIGYNYTLMVLSLFGCLAYGLIVLLNYLQ